MTNTTPATHSLARAVLPRIAAQAPHALRLAAQLLGVGACGTCDYVKHHCKCHEEGKGHE